MYPLIILGIVKERVAKSFNIININRLIFSLNIYRQGNTIFIISLYKINKLLKSHKKD
jgi:hypothetical protein